MSQQKYPKAYEAYQQAVYRDGRNPTFWCSIGVLYYQINQYRDALDAYSRAIRLNPYISEVWYDLGTLVSLRNSMIDCLRNIADSVCSMSPATIRSMMHWMHTSVQLSLIPAMFTSKHVFNCSEVARRMECLSQQVLPFHRMSILKLIKLAVQLDLPGHNGVTQLHHQPSQVLLLAHLRTVGEEQDLRKSTHRLSQPTILLINVMLLVVLFRLHHVPRAQDNKNLASTRIRLEDLPRVDLLLENIIPRWEAHTQVKDFHSLRLHSNKMFHLNGSPTLTTLAQVLLLLFHLLLPTV